MTTALIVLSHGLWGTKEHMEYIEGRLKDKYKDGVYILNVSVNEEKYSYDGIDICGNRVATQIMNTVESLKAKGEPLDKISLIGYSLGGLILRYAVGVLGQAGIFDTVTPHYFITFATPHLGVRSPSNSLFSKVFNYLSGTMVSRSGEQIQLVDHHGKENKPLLQIMSEPKSAYSNYLSQFKVRRSYANIAHDRFVPYWTAGMEILDYLYNKKDQLDITLDATYCSIVTGIDLKTVPSVHKKKKKMTKSTIIKYTVLALSPLLAPIMLILFFSMIGIQGLMSRHRVSAILSNEPSTQIEDHQHFKGEILTTGLLDGINLTEEDQDNQHTHTTGDISSDHYHINIQPTPRLMEVSDVLIKDEIMIEMQQNLTSMPWERIWVYIRAFNAHGNIVCRQKRFTSEAGMATVKHFIDTTHLV